MMLLVGNLQTALVGPANKYLSDQMLFYSFSLDTYGDSKKR